MRLLALLLSLSLLSASSTLAKKAAKPVESTKNLLSEFTHIEKLFGSSRNQYPLRADIIIPPDGDELVIMVHYDELSDHAVKDITWLAGRKQTPVAALSTESQINTQLEKMLNRSNPGLAYDRLQTGKHVITKTYKFKKSKIFNSKKAETQNLKVTWDNNAVIFVPAENLYLTEAEPVAAPKARPTQMSPAPSPMPEDSRGRKQAPIPSPQDLASEQLQRQKLYEYEMLEIESTLKQMKELESDTESAGMQQFMPGGETGGSEELGVPQLPEF